MKIKDILFGEKEVVKPKKINKTLQKKYDELIIDNSYLERRIKKLLDKNEEFKTEQKEFYKNIYDRYKRNSEVLSTARNSYQKQELIRLRELMSEYADVVEDLQKQLKKKGVKKCQKV